MSTKSSESIITPEKSNKSDTILELQLGDVITIYNPINEILNEKTFIIDYIDKSKTFLINVETLEKIKLKISEDGVIGDGNISKIAILSRSDTPSYARQNDLIPGKWINIYFGGEFPVIITGEITNLEEDMIEVKSIDGDTLYLNFDYKGLPEDLPIENIEIREKPQEPRKQVFDEEENLQEPELGIETELPNLKKDYETMETDKIQINIPVKNIKDQIREFILRADQIKFGDEVLAPIKQYVDVKATEQRYSIEAQVADLLDELLSTVPNSQRTPRVLDNIHIIIERFKQLREKNSAFDEYGTIIAAQITDSTYKPLSQYFNKFKQNLYWILPVVKNIKKVYDVENVYDENSDIVNIQLNTNLKKINEIIENYKSNTLPIEQNNYSALYNELNPYFTPFDLVGDENFDNIIIEKKVNSDINVIIDNLDDMYSSIFSNNNLRTKRFVIDRYNLGLTKLETKDSTNSRLITNMSEMTKPDVLGIKTFITLPEPAIKFSVVNLPGSYLLDKSNLNLHFLNYWEFLKKKTNIDLILIDNLTDEIKFDENNFANSIKSYFLYLGASDVNGLTKTKLYKKFIKMIVPQTKVLFNLMKKYITGRLSIVDVVSYLEPFLVYTDDLTYMQYIEIIKFISEKISEHNKKFIERSRLFMMLSRVKSNPRIFENAFSLINILSNNYDLRETVLNDGYNLIDPEKDFTNSEILRKIMIKDNSLLYTTGLSLQSISLMFPSQFSGIFEDEFNKNKSSLKKEEEKDDCKTMTISKFYKSLESLQLDNDKPIYFDKKYDKTNYGILENYEKEIIKLSPEELLIHIKKDLMNKKTLSEKELRYLINNDKNGNYIPINEQEAEYLANTLLDGHKKVLDGQYAILYKGYKEKTSEEIDYYVRRENKWVLDEKMSNIINSEESSILCNLQEKCINVPINNNMDDKCVSIQVDELGLQNKLLKDVINEFDTKYKISKEDFEKEINEKYNYYLNNIVILNKLEIDTLLKYNNQKYNLLKNKLGNFIDDNSFKPISPSQKLLNLILNQKDFVKKQQDLIRFVNIYTRPSVDGFGPLNELESLHWLYCLTTNVPLLPRFKFDLAVVFINNQSNYINQLDIIKSKIGKLSDDGDWWTDQFSGWPICPVDFDLEEGYEEGFKISTRSIMEEDAGNKIIAATAEKQIMYSTHQTKMINNVINAISIAMGINMENQKEFIINNVVLAMKDNLESESDYNEKVKHSAEKGKKILSYKDSYNKFLLYYTLGLFLIASQTAIPPIKTRKTHPGCIRSFQGYPFEGAGDLSSLNYIACVAYDIRESGEPWNVLKKRDTIITTLKLFIDEAILNLPDVKRRFEEKTDYLLTLPATIIPEEHDIAKWYQFLPPLIPFKIRHLVNVSEEFRKSLTSDLRHGNQSQYEKILVIGSKIIYFSLAIQELIGDIVKKNQLLLHNSNNEPYLENACCESSDNKSTIDFFKTRNANINGYNDIVMRLTNMLEDINSYSTGGLFYSNINTKNVYPAVSNEFNEKTIYLAFIYYCKFKSLVPIPTQLIPYCTDKPDSSLINPNDSIERIIQKLKDDGRNYTNQQFLRLIQVIGRENIVKINLDKPEFSSISKLLNLIDSIDSENDDVIESSLRGLIKSVFDTFDIASEESTKEIKDLNNYLIRGIESMKDEIIEFIDKNSGSNLTNRTIKKAKEFILNFSKWSTDESTHNDDIKISNEKMYNIINFYKKFIENFAKIFPNIILNKVDHNHLLIPNYLGFSLNHSNKLKKNYKEYYEKLHSFYGNPILLNILTTIQNTTKNIVKMSDNTPSFSNIKIGEVILKPVFDERTSRFLFEYYLLRVIINYIELSDNEEMIVTEVPHEEHITDLFSVEYLEERDTRIDLSMSSRTTTDIRILSGNKKELRQKTTQLLISYIEIMNSAKDTTDISYEDIQDRVFKLREKEKDRVTDSLKRLTDEGREIDTILKINKLNQYSKGLQKGLTVLDKDFYDEEQEFRDEMAKAEKIIRKKHLNATDDEVDQLIEDYREEQDVVNEIDDEVNDMSYMNDDYYNGNTDGVGAPEEDYGDYDNYD
jgi:hypothetical protein